MKFNPSSMVRATILLATALPLAIGRAINKPRAVLPSEDPFYQPPAGFESQEAGTVLRSRRIAASFFGFIPDPVETHQILYRTTAVNGSSIAAVTTVFKPFLAKKDRFITYSTAYDSSSSTCSPSYSYQLGSSLYPSVTTTNAIELLVVELYLLSGYIVSSPDYEGPDAAFTSGHLSGMGVLDSMRAVSNFGSKIGLTEKPKILGAGYSGGGLATAWAAALQPAYAPELPIKGWTAGGIPANLTSTFEYIDGKILSGFQPISVAGLVKPSAYGDVLQPLLNKIATPLGKKVLEIASTQCALPNLVAFPFQSMLDTKYQSLGAGLLTDPTIASILKKNTLGVNRTETPSAPFLMYHAKPDELVPYGPVATIRKSWCEYGASIKFTEYANGGHATTAVLGLLDAVKFVGDAFADSIAPGCTSRTVLDDTLNPLAFGVTLEPLAVGLINYLVALGRKDVNWLDGIKNGKPI